ncbi:MAG TPA: hypothetical protein VEJ47_12155 [Candidatus Eremiobacteraceae bacterium]|nr:hypothetical protein [Candidatus Eremiobacteraceae bacterium]
MSIEKKSLISTLKTTKKANVASSPVATNDGSASRKAKIDVPGLRKAKIDVPGLRKATVDLKM